MANRNPLATVTGRTQQVPETDWLLTQALASNVITASGTIPANKQYICFGALTINTGVVVTVSSGGNLVIL